MSENIIDFQAYRDRKEQILSDLAKLRLKSHFERDTVAIKDDELRKVSKELIEFYDTLPRLLGDSEELYKKLDLRVLFAREIHEGQKRKFENTEGGEEKPYLAHLLRVASSVADYLFVLKDSESKKFSRPEFLMDILSAALLHDSVEDRFEELIPDKGQRNYKEARSVALDKIQSKFGEQVRVYVNILSKPAWENKDPELYQDWVSKIWEGGDPLSIILKLSDLKDNFDSIDALYGDALHAHWEGYFDALIAYERLFKKYILAFLSLKEYLRENKIQPSVLSDQIFADLQDILDKAGNTIHKDLQNISMEEFLSLSIIGEP